MYTSFHVSPKAKRRNTWVYQSEMLSCIAKTAIYVKGSKLQVKFPVEKNTLTVGTDDEQFNCRWTFTNRQLKQIASRISKDRPKTKSNEGVVYTPSRIKLTFIYTNFLSFWISWIKGHGLLFKFNYCSELPTSEHFY